MRTILLSLAIFNVAILIGQTTVTKETEKPLISVSIAGVPQGKVYLIGILGDQFYRADSSVFDASGKLEFKREELYERGFYYLHDGKSLTLQMLIDQDQTFSLETKLTDLVGAMSVKGNLDCELLYTNLKFENEIQPKFNALAARLKATTAESPEYLQAKAEQDELVEERKNHLKSFQLNYPDSFFTKFKMAGQNPEASYPKKPDGTVDTDLQVYLFRNSIWNNVDFNDDRLLRTPIISNKLKKYMLELTVQSADSVISSADALIERVLDKPEYFKYFCNWIAINYDPEKSTIMDPQAVRVHLTRNYFTYEKAFWFKDKTYEIDRLQQRADEMEASLVGLKGPNVTSTDPQGKTKSIYDIKSPYIIVYMYNPTCEHCMEETPKLVEFYKEWKDKGVEVFAIALDTDDAEWKDYIAKTGMSWTNVYDPTNRSIYKKYYVDITPEIYVLNPERIIIAKNMKTHQIEEVINKDKEKRQ